ncbi:MAG: methyltransferase domain-containing protein [Geobacter sp.]|nr:methyltransferase domain-containing protein [Geobacter sp.]
MSTTNPFSNIELEKVQNYWNARPCNIRHSTSPVGTKQYFDEVEARKYFVEPHIPLFAEFEKWRGKKVLEIGCGIGTDTINFARAGAQVTAVDLSTESLALAKKRAEVFGLDNITFYQANAEQLSDYVPVERYDLVYSFGVIHHTPHPELVVEQIQKYMDKDSVFKIMVYYRASWKVFWMQLKYGKKPGETLDELIARYSEAETGCPVTYSYTTETIKGFLKGFEIIDTKIDHIFPYSIPEYRNYLFKKVWYFRYLPQALFRWMEQRWGWHLCVTARKNDNAKIPAQ